MKKLVTLELAGICALAFASVADAGTVLRQNSVSTIRTSENVTHNSSVYANTATNSYSSCCTQTGHWIIDYIYSSDLTCTQTVLDNLRNALNNPYKDLVPSVANEATATGLQVLNVSHVGTVAGSVTATASSMNDNWKSSAYVAKNVIPGRGNVSQTSANAGIYQDALDQQADERDNAVDDTVETTSSQFISHLDSRTVTDVYNTIEDGQVVRHSDINVIYDSEKTTIYSTTSSKWVSPLVLDITGNGVLQASNGQNMPGHPVVNSNVILADFYGDGFEIAMEWVGPQDGLLVAPKADGSVDMSCLFGTAGGYDNGYEKLSLYDNNEDNLINGSELNGLSVWQDANGNGIADAGEVKTVQELGITEIAINPDDNFVSSFTMNGNTNKMWDWWPNALELVKVAAR